MESKENEFNISKLYKEASEALGAEAGINFIDKIVDTGKFSVEENISEIIKFFAQIPETSREELEKALFSLKDEQTIMAKFNSLKTQANKEDSKESISTLISRFKKHVTEVVVSSNSANVDKQVDNNEEKPLKKIEESERPGLDLIDSMMLKMNMLKQCNVVPQHIENFAGALTLQNIKFGKAIENKFLTEVIPHIIKLIEMDKNVYRKSSVIKIRDLFNSPFWPESIRNTALQKLRKYE